MLFKGKSLSILRIIQRLRRQWTHTLTDACSKVLLEKLSSSARQKMSCILWNTKDHRRVRKCPLLVPLLSQVPSAYTTSQIIPLRSIVVSFSHLLVGLPSGFPTKIMYAPLLPAVRAAPTAHLILYKDTVCVKIQNFWMLKQVVHILDVLPSPSSITLKVILLRPLHGAGDRIYLAIFFVSILWKIYFKSFISWDKRHQGQLINNDDNMAYVMTYRKQVEV